MSARARWLALLASVVVVVEASSWVALRVLGERRGLRYRTYDGLIEPWRPQMEEIVAADGTWYQRIDPELGWITIPGATTDDAAITASGIRAARDYAATPPPGVVRIAAFGDSFVHGDEVATGETWTAALERALPRVEVLNYGVGGYGLDQALLRYEREGARMAPHVVLVGVITDDVLRGVNVFRPFFAPTTGHVLTKPRFLLDDAGRLELLRNPLPGVDAYRAFLADPVPKLREIVRHDDYAPPVSDAGPLDALASVRLVKLLTATLRRSGDGERQIRRGELNLDAEPSRLALAVLHRFVERVRANGAEPLIVIFPDRTELDARRDGRAISYRPLRDRLRDEGIPVVDVLDGFDALAPDWTTEKVLRRSHYAPWGNELVAGFLAQQLVARQLVPAPPAGVPVDAATPAPVAP